MPQLSRFGTHWTNSSTFAMLLHDLWYFQNPAFLVFKEKTDLHKERLADGSSVWISSAPPELLQANSL